MRIRRRYTLPNGVAITLEHVDFGLFTVSIRGKVLREFHCVDKAHLYMSSAITVALNSKAIRAFKQVA